MQSWVETSPHKYNSSLVRIFPKRSPILKITQFNNAVLTSGGHCGWQRTGMLSWKWDSVQKSQLIALISSWSEILWVFHRPRTSKKYGQNKTFHLQVSKSQSLQLFGLETLKGRISSITKLLVYPIILASAEVIFHLLKNTAKRWYCPGVRNGGGDLHFQFSMTPW